MSTADLNETFRTFSELLHKEEPLHPDLADWVVNEKGEMGWRMLKHPLVFAVPYLEGMNAVYNEQYRYKQVALADARESRKWGTYLYLHERPHRFVAFAEIENELTDPEYWKLLGDIWTDSENLWQISFLPHLLNSKRRSRENIMDPEERAFLADLPDQFMVYRGHQKINRSGYSWTLSYNKAKWFARRWQNGGDGHVACAVARKEDVIAYFAGRGEFEIVVDPKKVKIKSLRKLERPGILSLVWAECVEAFPLKNRQSQHGPSHWEKVERNAVYLARRTEGANILVARLFAIVHDCQRQNENDDPEHGRRAAEFLLQKRKDWMLDELGKEEFNKLLIACQLHNHGGTSEDPTIGVCWDADRLDLPRVGISPDPKLLSTEAGRGSIWKI